MPFDELAATAATIGVRLIERGQTIAVAEGAAGGLISAALLSVPGASAFFVSSSVLYTLPGFTDFLGPQLDELRGLRGATEEFSLQLARIARDKFDATWAIGESGAAGPTGNRYGDAPGHLAIGVAGPTEVSRTIETGSDDRTANMQTFAAAALTLFAEAADIG